MEQFLEGKKFMSGPQSANIHREDKIHVALREGLFSLRAYGLTDDAIRISISAYGLDELKGRVCERP